MQRLVGDLREGEEVVDQLRHHLGVAGDAPEHALALGVQLGGVVLHDHLRISADGSQRRAQVVGDGIGKSAQFVVGIAELRVAALGVLLGAVRTERLSDQADKRRRQQDEAGQAADELEDFRTGTHRAQHGQTVLEEAVFLVDHHVGVGADLFHLLHTRTVEVLGVERRHAELVALVDAQPDEDQLLVDIRAQSFQTALICAGLSLTSCETVSS